MRLKLRNKRTGVVEHITFREGLRRYYRNCMKPSISAWMYGMFFGTYIGVLFMAIMITLAKCGVQLPVAEK